MSRNKSISYLTMNKLSFILVLVGLVSTISGDDQAQKYYIVYVGEPLKNEEFAVQKHIEMLATVKGSDLDAKKSLVHSYTKNFNAFAAKLSEADARELSGMDNVLSVIPNKYHKLHTTRSWDFLGLHLTARRKLKMERNVIVGLLDTGITPQSESFKDNGLGPPPKKWKGICQRSANFSGCNNKLIGARYFKLDGNPDPYDILSPLDTDGHGTHTSSTAAGNVLQGASLFGLAEGTARGAVPSARVAVYKVCWASFGCSDMDILAAFDAAILDGVDVISISIGGGTEDYLSDSITIGAFHAMRKGIISVASAGNDGPSLGSLLNVAPWIFTVGASGIDRQFRSKVELGNGKTFSVRDWRKYISSEAKMYPFVTGGDVAKDSESKEIARFCYDGTLDPRKVKGKLIHCKLGIYGTDALIKELGGVGTVIESTQYLDNAQIFMAPGTMVNVTVGKMIEDYIHSTRSPSGIIYRTHEVKVPAPFIASFSSRGPNPGSTNLLKPDIAAPGIDILASYTLLKSLTGLKGDTQFSKFTLMSGTSMSCPHVAGIAAYVKSFHPDWSPAAIKSAIMTTATPMSPRVDKDAEFAYGAGQVNPVKALSPGLVYDIDDMSYVQFLCHEGYEGSAIALLIGVKSVNCSSLIPGHGHDALNYPTMQLSLENNLTKTTTFRRTVTNVGPAQSIYNVAVRAPKGVEIIVKPTCLYFSRPLQKRSFKVVVKAKPMSGTQILSASLVWKSCHHVVRSPIVIYVPQD